MEKLTVVTGVGVPLRRSNVDTATTQTDMRGV